MTPLLLLSPLTLSYFWYVVFEVAHYTTKCQAVSSLSSFSILKNHRDVVSASEKFMKNSARFQPVRSSDSSVFINGSFQRFKLNMYFRNISFILSNFCCQYFDITISVLLQSDCQYCGYSIFSIWCVISDVLFWLVIFYVSSWTYHFWRAIFDVSFLTCYLWRVIFDVSFLTCYLWRVIFDVSYLMCYFWRVIFTVSLLMCHFWRIIFDLLFFTCKFYVSFWHKTE